MAAPLPLVIMRRALARRNNPVKKAENFELIEMGLRGNKILVYTKSPSALTSCPTFKEGNSLLMALTKK